MKGRFKAAIGLAAFACAVFAVITAFSLRPIEKTLHEITAASQSIRVTDRTGLPLSLSYQSPWNTFDVIPLYEMPDLLKDAFLFSEDRNYFDHGGVNWSARLAALVQNIQRGETVRGASTITEQVVRLINPRPRSLWSRWLEGFEAANLDKKISKADLLEFYLNQVPYAANRRGVAQAAWYYFNRDLSTLTSKEMLALAVLVRAPSAYDPARHPGRIDAPLKRLASAMVKAGKLAPQSFEERLDTQPPLLPVEARHFARYARLHSVSGQKLRSTLDAGLQAQVQTIVDTRLVHLRGKNVHNAAAVVADHQTGEILAWVVGGSSSDNTPAPEIDTVTTPRQPGSAMKPFVYASALERGWTAATLLDDAPLVEAIGMGLHNFRNYSNTYYGPITLREALGNSLNIPALLAIRHVGTGPYLTTLQKLGFKSLSLNSTVYDEGLALGNGEVTLLEMAQGYAALAQNGLYRELRAVPQETPAPVRVFSAETASLIGNILSDPSARRLEFGAGSVLNLPVQTAVKTGTSTDYRDAWTLSYNDRYVVGLWMGNLNNEPMDGITGSTGPALALRSIYSLLNRNRDTKPLPLSVRLTAQDVCTRPAESNENCPLRTEWFAPGTIPYQASSARPVPALELVRPTEGLQIAFDPRIPASHQKMRFEVRGLKDGDKTIWTVDDGLAQTASGPTLLWPVVRGRHTVAVQVEQSGEALRHLPEVTFLVK